MHCIGTETPHHHSSLALYENFTDGGLSDSLPERARIVSTIPSSKKADATWLAKLLVRHVTRMET